MSCDTAIYTRRVTMISAEEVLTQLRARREVVKWIPNPLAQPLAKSPAFLYLMGGAFSLEGRFDPASHIDLSVYQIGQGEIQRLLNVYQDVITEPYRQSLLATQIRYLIATAWALDLALERVLVNLVDVMADLGQGLILDMQTNHFYDRNQYRERYAGLFGE